MVRVRVVLDEWGLVRLFEAHGHAGSVHGTRGNNIVCAAATAIVRTVARQIAGHPEITSTAQAAGEGSLMVEISGVPMAIREWLRGVGDILVGGIGDLATEYPDDVRLVLERIGTDGT